jgi:hypothetical protein
MNMQTKPIGLAVLLACGGLAHTHMAQAQTSHSGKGFTVAEANVFEPNVAARLDAQQQLVQRLLKRIEDLELQNARGRGLTSASSSNHAPQSLPQTVAQATAPAAPAIGQDAKAAQEAEEQQRTPAQTLAGKQDPQFERKFTLDSGVSYTRLDRRQIALAGFYALDSIFLGTLSLDQVKGNTLVFDSTARYGLTDRWTVDANVPLIYRQTTFVSEGAQGAGKSMSEADANKFGLGDISVGASYQFKKEADSGYDLLGALRVRLPTGSSPFGIALTQPVADNTNLNIPERLPTGNGIYSLQATATWIKTLDPLVVFGTVGWIHNLKRDVKDLDAALGEQPGSVKLGDALLLGGGTAFAVNDTTALSLGANLQFTLTSKTKAQGGQWSRINGSKGVGATVNLGLSHQLNKKSSISASVAMGLTQDAPNFSVGVRVPYAF